MEQEKIDEIRAIDKSMSFCVKELKDLRNFRIIAGRGNLTIECSRSDAFYLNGYEVITYDFLDKLEESLLLKIAKFEKQLKEL